MCLDVIVTSRWRPEPVPMETLSHTYLVGVRANAMTGQWRGGTEDGAKGNVREVVSAARGIFLQPQHPLIGA